MKISIYRHSGGFFLVTEIMELGSKEQAAVRGIEPFKTNCRELASAGLANLAEMLVGRAFLAVPQEEGEAVVSALERHRNSYGNDFPSDGFHKMCTPA